MFKFNTKLYTIKKGFTLAEVLITLGIIGVVAAVTIPTLINNSQKTSTISKIKKFYTNMSQALKLSAAENGDFTTWTYADTTELYDKYLSPYLNVQKVYYNTQFQGDFIGGVRIIFNDGTQAICSQSSNFTGRPVCIFNTKAGGTSYPDFKVNPFSPYRETFYFVIDSNGNLTTPHITNTRAQNLDNCQNHSFAGLPNGHEDCSTLLIKDSWQFNSDYPWN